MEKSPSPGQSRACITYRWVGKPPKGIRKGKLKVYKELKVYERLSTAQNDCSLTYIRLYSVLWLTVAFGTVEMYKNLLRRIVTAQIDEAVYRGAECWQRRQTRYSHLLVSVRGRHLLTFADCRFDSSTNLQRARGSLTSRR